MRQLHTFSVRTPSSATWNTTCGVLHANVMRLMRLKRSDSGSANQMPSSPVVFPSTAWKKSAA